MASLREAKNIVLGVSGSVAAYKATELARLLVSRGYQVRVVMTECATRFIAPLLMESVTGQHVSTNFHDGSELRSIGHIQLADWADTFVVVPATANIIAKLAIGIADCPVSTVALATRAPVLIAPAMNVNMYEHQATQDNITILRKRGVSFVDPEEGELACGWQGTGRLASPWEIFNHIRRALSNHDLEGKHILITTGPTREAVDPVRYVSNRSSGKMGVSLAREAFRRGAKVTLIHGPISSRVPAPVDSIAVLSAEQMLSQVMASFESINPPDIIIMAAAVADFRPKNIATAKIKKHDALKSIELVPNTDILLELGKRKERDGGGPKLVGFAVETGEVEELLSYARSKLEKKNADMIVANLADDAFEGDTNRVWILDRNGREEEVSLTFKSRIANKVLDAVQKL